MSQRPYQRSQQDLDTPRLRLAWVREDMLRALIAGPAEFEALTGWPVAEAYMDFPGALEFSLDQWVTGAADPEYWMYLILKDDCVIGLCGYKGGPGQNADETVEVGYSIAPEHQGRGYATEATAALVAKAVLDSRVRGVVACTLGEVNASCRVLEKNGFRKIANIVDPEEGTIWKWRIDLR
jgi:ribosomal-protein-alanine N-acetyltransferase